MFPTREHLYALMAIGRLAKRPKGTVVSICDLSKDEGGGIPALSLAKILQKLKAEGIVKSHRGRKGGFSLAQGAQEINVGRILRCCDRKLIYTGSAPAEILRRRMNRKVEEFFSKQSISEIMEI